MTDGREQIHGCAISPDGSLIATGSKDKTASVIDAATGKAIYTTTHGDDVRSVFRRRRMADVSRRSTVSPGMLTETDLWWHPKMAH